MKIRAWRLALGVVIAVIVPLAIFAALVVVGSSSGALRPRLETPEDFRWVVLVVRHPEKARAEEHDKPFRASPLALYRREGTNNAWILSSQRYLARSTTSSAYSPSESDLPTVERWIETYQKPYSWGHSSVPIGVFALVPPDSSEDKLRHPDSLLIRDLNTRRKVSLDPPQTLYSVLLKVTDEGTKELTPVEGEPRTSSSKTDCLLHGSPTREWSHRDSYGCINLLDQSSDGSISDWHTFRQLIEDNNILQPPGQAGLIVLDGNTTKVQDTDDFPQRIVLTFHKDGARWQASLDP